MDAAAYNELKHAPARATPRPVPPVARPGVSRGAANVSGERNMRALNDSLNQSGSINDALRVLQARRGR